ncbi:MAG: FIST signal transduction protein [Planctomycetota bacterium]
MEIETLSYSPSTGWSSPLPKLNSDKTLVLLFGSRRYSTDPAPIAELVAAFPSSRIVGCSSSGEILGDQLYDDTLSVAIARFSKTKLALASAAVNGPEDSFGAGQQIANQLLDSTLRGVMVLSDGLRVNGSELVRGLNSTLPEAVVVTGGLAGDSDKFEQTWVIHKGKPCQGVVSAVGFYGDAIHIGHGSKGGWDVFGPERLVTKSSANILYELDGKPALPLYKQYLGDRAAGLPATALLFPLALRNQRDSDKSLVRTVLSVDEKAQSMIFAGDIPVGSRVQLMRANFDRLVDGASGSALMTRQNAGSNSGPCLSIAVSCVGRRLVLGERTEEELESVLDVLPVGSQQVGFYSYGEISPYATGHCDLHNQTMTLTTLTEA